jgi:hypothetical protein
LAPVKLPSIHASWFRAQEALSKKKASRPPVPGTPPVSSRTRQSLKRHLSNGDLSDPNQEPGSIPVPNVDKTLQNLQSAFGLRYGASDEISQ